MELVLNKCYGGFGLSHAAKMKILEKKGITVFPYMDVEPYDFGESKYKKIFDQELEEIGHSYPYVAYFQNDPGQDEIVVDGRDINRADYKDFDFEGIERFDKELVETVKELGDKSGGEFAYLEVVEIPDGASFEISEYDGIETAHFGFQTGSV